MARTWHRNQALARQTTTSTTYADVVGLTYVFGAAWEDISMRRSESYGREYGSSY